MIETTVVSKKDEQTVTPAGERLVRWISGVTVRSAVTHVDERGEICEIYDPAWGVLAEPLCYVYQSTVRPGRVKGWVYHKKQLDRLFVSAGFLKIVLYDLREDSETSGKINEIFLSERNRGLVVIPPFVLHAVQNVGDTDGLFVNMPSRPYDHKNPDKYRIAMDSGQIPYSFDRGIGW